MYLLLPTPHNEVMSLGLTILPARTMGHLTKPQHQASGTTFWVVGQRTPRGFQNSIGYYCCPWLPWLSPRGESLLLKTPLTSNTGLRKSLARASLKLSSLMASFHSKRRCYSNSLRRKATNCPIQSTTTTSVARYPLRCNSGTQILAVTNSSVGLVKSWILEVTLCVTLLGQHNS